MNPLLRSVIGIQESEEGKASKPTVVYLTPEQIGTEEGAHCGECFFFNRETSECLLTSPAKCNAEHGVCDLYLHGDLRAKIEKVKLEPQQLIPKEDVGYEEDGPTHCASCEYFKDKGAESGPCEKVKGTVHSRGCCNGYEKC